MIEDNSSFYLPPLPMLDISKITKIVVWSTNPVKIQAAKAFFAQILPHNHLIEWVKVPSNVSDQPLSKEETVRGAKNRCQAIMQTVSNTDLAIGMEWWVYFQKNIDGDEQCFLFWVVAIVDATWYSHYEFGGRVIMPPSIATELKKWTELWPLMDTLLSEANIKHKQWTIGVLTKNIIARTDRFADNIATAFVPRIHPQWFSNTQK